MGICLHQPLSTFLHQRNLQDNAQFRGTLTKTRSLGLNSKRLLILVVGKINSPIGVMLLTLPSSVGPRTIQAPLDGGSASHSSMQPLEEPLLYTEPWLRLATEIAFLAYNNQSDPCYHSQTCWCLTGFYEQHRHLSLKYILPPHN